MAAKRDEYVRRGQGDPRGASGQRRAVHAPADQGPAGDARPAGGARVEGGRPVSDAVPSESLFDRLGYVPADAGSAADAPLQSGTAPARDTWSSALDPSTAPLALEDDGTTPPPRTLRDQLSRSGGFYSGVVPSVESVTIPRPPRLPDLGSMDAGDAPPPGSDTPPMAARLAEAARGPKPDSLLIPPLLRRQAEEWKRTGSLTLPSTVSSRHARALQRALLLSMLQASEFSLLPEGIAQRAAWMFREGWGEGKKARDADDLCFVLGLRAGPSARAVVISAANAHIPAESLLPPSSARWSSRPPRPAR